MWHNEIHRHLFAAGTRSLNEKPRVLLGSRDMRSLMCFWVSGAQHYGCMNHYNRHEETLPQGMSHSNHSVYRVKRIHFEMVGMVQANRERKERIRLERLAADETERQKVQTLTATPGGAGRLSNKICESR